MCVLENPSLNLSPPKLPDKHPSPGDFTERLKTLRSTSTWLALSISVCKPSTTVITNQISCEPSLNPVTIQSKRSLPKSGGCSWESEKRVGAMCSRLARLGPTPPKV